MVKKRKSASLFRIAVLGIFIFYFSHNGQAGNFPGKDSPDLIVGIVIDKMRYDYITRMWDQFGDHGFKRLIAGGSSFSNARYDYLINQSSSGYATIFTGANPSTHGIIADSWYDRLRDESKSGVFDENVIAVGGSFGNGQRSPVRMFTGTVGDELRMANDFRSRVYSVSLNDASAILSGGFSANAAWWYDDVNGEWMSSSYYIDRLPAWVRDFNSSKLPDMYLDRKWEPLISHDLYFGISGDSKSEPFQYDLKRMRRRNDGYGRIRETPYGNTLTKDFAISLIANEQLGKNGYTDMIIVGFSATAGIGQKHGTFSMELQDAYLRLDKDISHFLDFLNENFGSSNTLVFLTSDQAVGYPASYNSPAKLQGGIFSPPMTISLLRSYLNVSFGQADWVKSYNAGMVYLNHNLIEDNNIQLGEIQNLSARFLNQFSGIAGTVTEDVMRRNYFSDGIIAKIQAGFHPKRSGDIVLYLQQGWHERNMAGSNVTIISYDQHVPLVFYGWKTGRNNFNRPVSVADIVPTISLMLNIPIPPFATGKPIMEMLEY
jgi:predicted AlkP superfamily pyrophosphatase or phosphodiesterase